MEVKVYIANLGKYNEGVLQGAWFALPVDFDFVSEKIGLNNEYEEYAIHDFESPVGIPEYISIDALNDMYNKLCEIEEHGIDKDDLPYLMRALGNLDDVYSNLDNIINHGRRSFENYAYDFLYERLEAADVDLWIFNYIDYEKYARDLLIEGQFVEGCNLYEITM